MSRRILITSAGSGPCNNLMRSLLHADPSTVLMGCHSDRFVLKQSRGQRNFLLPPPDSEEGRLSAFDQALRSVMTDAQIDLVIPGNDRDALVLAGLHERTPFPCHTFLPAPATIDLCQDKYVLYLRLRDRDIPVPQTYAVSDRASLIEGWRALGSRDLTWCRIRRGAASRGATMVRDADQAWAWISYWHTMRGVPVEDFTLSEFLPGRDYNVQGIWSDGRLILIKMCERLSYLNASQQPSGMASTPALAKTGWEEAAIEACEAALRAIDIRAHGVFNFDLKENDAGIACITEINAGRFAMITNLYDLTGRHNMAASYARLACGEDVHIGDPYDDPGEFYLIRELDTLPGIFGAGELFEGIEKV
jgi:predicted ATP-grasp superfamily ATP-dependent carboligase